MSEMVDRVARAIYQAEKPNHHADWDVFAGLEGNREFMCNVARAAIATLREPTEGMCDAGVDSGIDTAGDARECWQAMIDEALK